MYYKLTMKDKRVIYVPDKFLERVICEGAGVKGNKVTWGTSFETRLGQIHFAYPKCIDWEMVEDDAVPAMCMCGSLFGPGHVCK